MEESDDNSKPDPGFRIYHINKETGERREVPPYTSPGEFLEDSSTETEKDAPLFDGYQRIQEADAQDDNLLETMREARVQHR